MSSLGIEEYVFTFTLGVHVHTKHCATNNPCRNSNEPSLNREGSPQTGR